MNISNSCQVIIEEIDSNDIPASELSEFQEAQPLKVVSVLSLDDEEVDENDTEELEGNLIQKFVHGEADFPDIYTKLEPYEEYEDGEIEDMDVVEQDNIIETIELENRDAAVGDSVETYQNIDTTLDYDYRGNANQRAFRKDKRLHGDDQPGTSKATKPFGGSGGGGPRRRPQLSVALQGLMGEANLSFARGQIQMAEKICLEIIRQNPLAPEPFFTLAEIYESRDTEKFLNFLTIAVHLNPTDRYQWIRIAEMHIAQDNLQRARIYYTRAIKVHQRDYDLRLRKARLLDMMGEKTAAMFTYLKMIQHCPADRHELCLVTAKNVATHFHALNKYQLALEAMESAYKVCGHLFALEDLNLYMELAILNKQYSKVTEHTTFKTFF